MKFIPCLLVAFFLSSCDLLFPGLPDCPDCPAPKPEWRAITFYGVGVIEKKYENCFSKDFGLAVKVDLLNNTPLGTRKILLYNVPENIIQSGKYISFQGERINEKENKIYCDYDTTVTEQYYVSMLY